MCVAVSCGFCRVCPTDSLHSEYMTQFSRTTVRELKLLRTLFHDNLVLLREVVASTVKDAVLDENDKPGSTYLVFEYLPYDLAGLIESGMDFTHDHIRWYALQLLRGIKYMHANDFVHRQGPACVSLCCAM
jgi:serine/threonine protein kinase